MANRKPNKQITVEEADVSPGAVRSVQVSEWFTARIGSGGGVAAALRYPEPIRESDFVPLSPGELDSLYEAIKVTRQASAEAEGRTVRG